MNGEPVLDCVHDVQVTAVEVLHRDERRTVAHPVATQRIVSGLTWAAKRPGADTTSVEVSFMLD